MYGERPHESEWPPPGTTPPRCHRLILLPFVFAAALASATFPDSRLYSLPLTTRPFPLSPLALRAPRPPPPGLPSRATLPIHRRRTPALAAGPTPDKVPPREPSGRIHVSMESEAEEEKDVASAGGEGDGAGEYGDEEMWEEGEEAPVAEAEVLNQQPEVEVDELAALESLERIRTLVGADTFGVTLVLVDDKESQRLNKQWRGVDAPTDILSFSALPPDTPTGPPPLSIPPPMRHLGDLVVCAPYVVRQCAADAVAARDGAAPGAEPDLGVSGLMASGHFTFEQRLPLLIIHGMLHLLGYDHETDEDHRIMAHREMEIWEAFQAQHP